MADLLYLMSFLTPPPLGAMIVDSFSPEEDPHITLLGPFSVGDSHLPLFRRYLTALSPWLSPLTLYPQGQALLGTEETPVPATLLSGEGVRETHLTLLSLLTLCGGQVGHPEFAGANYNPHISHWQGTSPLTFDSLTLVHHQEGFGKGVVTLAHYFFTAAPKRKK